MSLEQGLEWEEGYRAGIDECLQKIMLSYDNKQIWKQLTELRHISAARTDQILCEMEKGENGTS